MAKTEKEKLEEVRQKAAEGTKKPLPGGEPQNVADLPKTDAAKTAEAAAKEMAEIKARMDALKAELKAKKDAEAAAKKAAQEAAEKEAKEFEAKKAAATKAEATALEALQKLPQYVAWVKAKAENDALTPPEKVKSASKTRTRGTGTRSAGGLSAPALRALQYMAKAGRNVSRADLAGATGQLKGWSKLLGTREGNHEDSLCALGLVKCIQEEGEPMRYCITIKGRDALKAAEAELEKS